MVRFSYPATFLASLAALATQTEAQLSKPALRSNLDAFWPQLQSALRNPGYTIKTWPAGTIASGCKDLANREKIDPTTITTYEVLYGDCSVPWLLCRHPSSKTSIDTMALRFGQVPVKMRQLTKDVMLVPDTSTHAYALGNQVVFFNQVDTIGVYIHEIAHTVDFSSGYAVSGQLSGNQIWLDAYNADSAVPDNYARTNQVENIAQFPGLALFDQLVSGGVKSIEPNVGKIANQLATLKDQASRGDYGGNVLGQSNSCTARYANSAPVSASATSSVSSRIMVDAASSFISASENSFEAQVERFAKLGIEMFAELELPQAPTNCSGYL